MSAGDLPADVLEKIFGQALQLKGHWEDKPLGEASRQLRLALLLASTCRAWRHAASTATQALGLELRFAEDTLPQYLSPLLGELVAGCCCICLLRAQLAAPSLPRFLELARPAVVSAWAARAGSPPQGSVLHLCTSVSVLWWLGWPLPALPHSLRALTVLEGFAKPDHARQLFQDLRGLPQLSSLCLLKFAGAASVLIDAACFGGFSPLRELTVHFERPPYSALWCLAAVAAAAASGVRVTLSIEYVYDVKDWQSLWAALLECPQLHRLHVFVVRGRGYEHAPAPVLSSVQQLLAQVSCKELAICVEPVEPASSPFVRSSWSTLLGRQ